MSSNEDFITFDEYSTTTKTKKSSSRGKPRSKKQLEDDKPRPKPNLLILPKLKKNSSREETLNHIRKNRRFGKHKHDPQRQRNAPPTMEHSITKQLSEFLDIPQDSKMSDIEILNYVKTYCINKNLITEGSHRYITTDEKLRKLLDCNADTTRLRCNEYMSLMKKHMLG